MTSVKNNKLDPLCIPCTVSIRQAMDKLNKTAQKILFVIDAQCRLLGTMTDGDIRRAILQGSPLDKEVISLMNKDFIALTDSDANSKEEAKQIMLTELIEAIPVIDPSGRLVDVLFWNELFGAPRVKTKTQHPNHVVIMAGGKGARLDPFTRILPKPLIPIGEKPIIEIIMDRFFEHGFSRFIYTLNYKKEYIKTFLKELNKPFTTEWVEEKNYLGTAGSLGLLKDKIDQTFFVNNCDSVLDIDFADLLNWHRAQQTAITIVGCHQEVRVPYGTLELNNGSLNKITEKPIYDVTINTGVYVMEPMILEQIAPGEEIDMNTLIEKILTKHKIAVYPTHNQWFDIGQWNEYYENLKKIRDKI